MKNLLKKTLGIRGRTESTAFSVLSNATRTHESGSVLILGVVGILLLGAVSFSIQGVSLSTSTVGFSDNTSAQSDLLQDSYKNVIVQHINKARDGA